MSGKSFFVDLTKCTACRGCQVACKQWKKLPGEKTKNAGSHQNPPDLSDVTLRVVRFSEKEVGGNINWFFLPDQCRHCLDAPCKSGAALPDSIIVDPDTGAVIYTEKTAKENGATIRSSCPYDIPRVSKKTKVVAKCDMCNDRVKAGKLPACVLSCPTGTMNFGDRGDMLAMAKKALETARKKWPNAQLVDEENVRVIFLTQDKPGLYAKNLMAEAAPGPRLFTRQEALAALTRPLRAFLG